MRMDCLPRSGGSRFPCGPGTNHLVAPGPRDTVGCSGVAGGMQATPTPTPRPHRVGLQLRPPPSALGPGLCSLMGSAFAEASGRALSAHFGHQAESLPSCPVCHVLGGTEPPWPGLPGTHPPPPRSGCPHCEWPRGLAAPVSGFRGAALWAGRPLQQPACVCDPKMTDNVNGRATRVGDEL